MCAFAILATSAGMEGRRTEANTQTGTNGHGYLLGGHKLGLALCSGPHCLLNVSFWWAAAMADPLTFWFCFLGRTVSFRNLSPARSNSKLPSHVSSELSLPPIQAQPWGLGACTEAGVYGPSLFFSRLTLRWLLWECYVRGGKGRGAES